MMPAWWSWWCTAEVLVVLIACCAVLGGMAAFLEQLFHAPIIRDPSVGQDQYIETRRARLISFQDPAPKGIDRRQVH